MFMRRKGVGHNLRIWISYQGANFLISLANSSFSYHSTAYSEQLTILLKLCYLFVKISTHFEAIRCNAVITVIHFDMLLKRDKILLSKHERILNYVGLKKSYLKL